MNAFDLEGRREEEAAQARVLQAAVLMELFRRANQREAETAAELRMWAAANAPSKPIEPAAILSPSQITAALQDCRRRR
jgi:hypothetical protein